MPAVVETMFYQGKLPWHGEGIKIPDGKILSVSEGLEAAGLDWDVSLRPLMTVAKAVEDRDLDKEFVPNVGHRAVVRESDQSMLGVVGPAYHALQNMKAFEWFQPFLDAELCSLHTAGSLFDGKKIWVLAQINSDPTVIRKNDEVAKFIMLSNSHDGTSSVRVGYTPIRVVCANTLAMTTKSSGSQLLRVRHTSGMNVTLDGIRDIMNVANQTFEATAEKYQWLATRSIAASDLRKYVKVVMGFGKIDDKDMKTKGKNICDAVIRMATAGLGNNGSTYWDVYNGATEYMNHKQGRNESSRLNSLWFGTNMKSNKEALDLALEMAE